MKGEVAVVYCVLQTGVAKTALETVRAEIRDEITRELGKAFAPSEIHFVGALPKTRSAKIVRRAVRAAALGEDPGDLSSLEDPAVVERLSQKPASGRGRAEQY